MPVPTNTPGHILVRSTRPNAFFQGYFKAPEQTLSATANFWLHTSDLGRVNDDGNLFFLGRVKDVIRRRGENVNAFEVEEELLRHPEVVTAAAFAVRAVELGAETEDEVKVAVVRKSSIVLRISYSRLHCTALSARPPNNPRNNTDSAICSCR